MLYDHHMCPSRSQSGFPSILGSQDKSEIQAKKTSQSFHDLKSESDGSYACSQIIKWKETATLPRLSMPLQIVTQLFTGRRGDKPPEGLGHRHTDMLKRSDGHVGES